jgi:LysR family nitrogen assimilation transcriptional regulator
MDLEALKHIALLSREKSFSRAALKLGIAQPSLSKQVRGVEEELKTLLFNRHGRGVSLTDAGARFIAIVTPLLDSLDQLRSEFEQESKHPMGSVRLGVPPSIGATIGAGLVLNLKRAYPNIRLHVVEGFSGTLFEWIEAGAVDVAVLYDSRRSPGMKVEPVLRERLFLIRSAASPAPDRPIALADVNVSGLALPGPLNGLRRVVNQAFRNANIPLLVSPEIDSVATLRQLAMKGEYETILPWGAVHREVRDGRLLAIPIDSDDMMELLVIATALHRTVSPAMQAVIHVIHEEIAISLREGILVGHADKGSLASGVAGRELVTPRD